MKKILALLLVLVIVTSFASCGTQNFSVPSDESEKSTVIQADDSFSSYKEAENDSSTVESTTEQSNSIRPDFKAAMDSYEKFMNDYVAFMKKYEKNPSDIGLITDYAKYMRDYAKFVNDYEKWESEDMNTAETAYYIDVQARINKKLLEIAQ